MIDLHFHCLPGIDDGPRSWQESIALCKEAERQGTTTIVATPHVLRDPWLNEHELERDELLDKLNEFLGGSPTVLPGCEYYFSSDAVELWEQGSRGPLTGLNRSSYLLIEFPATEIPKSAESVIHELSLLDVIPVIAHPERNLIFAENPDKLARLIGLGAISQITAGSITGFFGKQAQVASEDFFKNGLIHLIASDAHSVSRRPPQLAEAREKVRSTWGLEPETLFFETVPTAILKNERIEI